MVGVLYQPLRTVLRTASGNSTSVASPLPIVLSGGARMV